MNKSSSHAFINQVLIGTLVMICFSGSLGFGTVWLRHQISLSADRNKQLETKLAEIERHIDETTAAIAAERSPDALVRRNVEWHLGLVPPREPQVVRVSDDVAQRLMTKNRAELYAHEVGPAATAVVFNSERER
ncbi:MAG TPA: hypothetical protein VK785_07775 [Opitutaceae bacterium]|jgi:hypothetical protein|nr:hypothetical protein [Opitutaceae bacterium]